LNWNWDATEKVSVCVLPPIVPAVKFRSRGA
jgi:hypothetical protein